MDMRLGKLRHHLDSEQNMTTYLNSIECHQLRDTNDKESTEEKDETTMRCFSVAGYAICFAASICISVIGTGYLTHFLLKMSYGECLKGRDVPEVKTELVRQPRDCIGHFNNGALVNGVYRITVDKNIPLQVFCDLETGGWTVIQRRTSGMTDFDRDWSDYVHGFGNKTGDHWIGLQNLNFITRQSQTYQIALEFLLKDSKQTATAVYSGFYVGDAYSNFTMKADSVVQYDSQMRNIIGDQDFFLYSNGVPFSTKDMDNDLLEDGNCVDLMECGGFWYKNCYMICLNGKFDSMFFFAKVGKPIFFTEVLVKIRTLIL